jgi:photosystem II stability/assembly factor-like uncharacterized protein
VSVHTKSARVVIASVPLIAMTAAHAPLTHTHTGTSRQQSEVIALTQESGTTQRLIAVSAVTLNIAWASGAGGTYTRTMDGGLTWKAGVVPGAEHMQFRDVHAIDGNNAYLLSIGKADSSRIYRTNDGGATWRLQFTNRDPDAFYDCFDFWDADHGIAVGDAIHGELAVLSTSDGGVHWARIPPATFPPALPKEGSFASSGTCIVTGPKGRAWIATTGSRVLRTNDFGKSWQVALTPVLPFDAVGDGTDSLGVSSVSFRDEKNGMAFGGFGSHPTAPMVAITVDGGASWEPRGRPTFPGGIYAGAFVTSALKPTIVAVGPTGSSYSRDLGATWLPIDARNYWGLGFAPGNRGWAVGSGGRITRLTGF